MTKRSFKRGNIIVELDRNQVIPDNPGDGCPAIVSYTDSRGRIQDSGSYNCVMNEGEFMDGRRLSPSELNWLAGLENEIEDFLYGESV